MRLVTQNGGWTPSDRLNTAIAIFTAPVACFLAALMGAKSGEGVSASAELLQFFVIRCNVSCRRPSNLSKRTNVMNRPFWQRPSSMANPSNKSPLVSVAIASLWRSLMKDIFDTYRPELHYMRGPGPKWHAKHRSQAQDSTMIGLVDAST